MEVLLLKDIRRLGKAGEIKKVADGYARNYLLPRGLAVIATQGAIRRTEVQRAIEQQRDERIHTDSTALAERLAGLTLVFEAKASEKGKLYGSITTADIAAEIERRTEEPIDKRKIELDEPIHLLGQHKVLVRLPSGIVSEVAVLVKAAAEAAS